MADPLTDVVAEIVARRLDEPRISPAWVATEAALKIDPLKINQHSLPLFYSAAHLALQQIARGLLRGHFEVEDDDAEAQHDLFPGLQRRYPAAHTKACKDPEYILLELLSDEDIAYNVARLEAEGAAKLKHATRLKAYGVNRRLGKSA
jgi:hypothetical protein